MASYIDFLTTLAVLFAITISIYGYFMHSYRYWKKKKVPYLEPVFPKGNNRELSTKTVTVNLNVMDFYDEIKSKGWKYAGIYLVVRPALVVIDPEHIKNILVKDFEHFVDRGFYYNEKDNPISAHLFALDTIKWREMRVRLTPTFTTGKMKMMFPMILEVSHYMMEAIEKQVDDCHDIDIKEFLARFTTDVIGTCAFGIECNSFKNPDAEFRRVGQQIFQDDTFIGQVKKIIISNAPELALKMGIGSIRTEISDFFHNSIESVIKYREENNARRSDFLQILIDLMNSTRDTDNSFTIDQLVSQVFLFFIAGFDTSSSAISFALYELAMQPDLQEKLRNEIHAVLEKDDGNLTYQNINEMHYLQQVIDETLRMYPSVPLLQRRCVKQYTLRNTDCVIDKGTTIIIPIINIQRDPEYFSDPLKFDPDRFSSENKKQRNPILHIPFGEGPRNCIGLRFGTLQTKIALVQILRKYKVSISPSTKMPLTLDRQVFLIRSVETLYLIAEKLDSHL